VAVDLEAFENPPVCSRHRLIHPRLEARYLFGLPVEYVHHHHRSLRTQGVVGDGPTGSEGCLEQSIAGFELVPGHGTLLRWGAGLRKADGRAAVLGRLSPRG
jgi:hypothetical protein